MRKWEVVVDGKLMLLTGDLELANRVASEYRQLGFERVDVRR